jgi:O-acetyl-ADP-ribose deacetylase
VLLPHFTQRVSLSSGDITRLKVDAIVNAANASLLGGGGVDGAIHRAAGPELLAECRALGGCPTGEAPADRGLSSFRAARDPYGRPDLAGWWCRRAAIISLENCYRSCLAIARRGFRDIAFPAIATGIYGFPGQEAAEIAVATVISHLARRQSLELVTFVCFDPATLEAYRKALGEEA